ncbi:hypothetical protein JKF63_04262 [Porcisia hertigi]|uniref:Protein kinase domain-containing protein n=1 Tax=Porcisia hertigi TaxID=2761500 RepID=A0A836HZU6_9TRYP|nr:hypothetical protein JKF63_04262 [Porcisia hertigi]
MSARSLYGGRTAIQENDNIAYCDGSNEPLSDKQHKPSKLGGHAAAAVELTTAVQVVDRLRWWRISRVRQNPIPVDHVVLRGSYTNYSCFGTRPIAPGVTRLLQKARTLLQQYRREQQRQQQEAYLRRQQDSRLLMASTTRAPVYNSSSERLENSTREMSRATGCVADEEERQPHLLCEMSDGDTEKVDNKRRSAVIMSPPRSPPTLNGGATACIGRPAEQRHPATMHSVCADVPVTGSNTTVSPPGKASLRFPQAADAPSSSLRAPSEQEARAAERLLSLFRPRAASAPLRSRRHRYTADDPYVAEDGVGDEPFLPRDQGCARVSVLPYKSITCASTSDDMADVRHAHAAAKTAIVLHHAPRLIVYEKGLSPRAALRAARISSDALEYLSDAAAESSAEVFSMTNLPLSSFERFFYQQQLRRPEERGRGHTPGMRSSSSPAAAAAADTDVGGAGVSPRDRASAEAGPAAATNITAGDGNCLVDGDGALFFGSPLMAAPARSPSTSVSPPFAAAWRATPRRGRCLGGGQKHKSGGRRSTLRAVSVPILPLVYKGGYPQEVTDASRLHRSCQAPPQKQPRDSNPTSSIIPAGLRSSMVPEDGGHMCCRVDDLQDVYVFNPMVDMIGRGAFSKVYAAVPILRGKEGLQRFASPLLGGHAAACGGEALGSGVLRGRGSPVPISRRATLVPRRSYSPAGHANPACGAGVNDTAGSLADDEAATGSLHTRSTATSLRSIPVVALKVISRKARDNSRVTPGPQATTPSAVAAVAGRVTVKAQQGAQHNDNSVRRELVEIEREVSILRRLHHTGCSQFFEAIRTPDSFVIAMGMFPGSMDAQHYLSRYGPPSEARAALMLFQLLSTVQYLHTNFGLIHRDIKLENMILSEVDGTVSDACIRDVLGTAVHKVDASTAETGEGGGRQGRPPTAVAAGTRTAAQLGYPKLPHNVQRLLRVTLIDFGLARRTRTGALLPAAAAVVRGRGAGVRQGSLNTSTTSPVNLAAFLPSSASPVAGSHHVHKNPTDNAHSGSSWTLASPGAGSAAGGVAPTNGGSISSHGYTSAKVALPRPPLLRQPASAVVGAGAAHLGPGAASIGGIDSSVSHLGMPSPMPSTTNMFTCFLDREEEMDEDENGGVGPAVESMATVNTDANVAGLGRGSRQDMTACRDDGDGAFSTDVSASETDPESGDNSTAELEEASTASEKEYCKSAPENERGVRPALLSPSVLTVQRQVAPEAATISVPPPPPTLVHLSHSTAVTPDHVNAANSGGHGNTSALPAGGSGLRNPSIMNSNTSHHQPLTAPPIVAVGGHTAPDDTDATLLLTPCGTEKYLPPEMLSWILEHGWVRRSTTVGLARAMDLYPIGIVAYVLLSGCFPFNASSRATLLKQQQRVPRCNSPRWAGVSSAAISFVQRLLEPNPLKRMTAREALEHPFLQEARLIAEKLSLVPHGEGEELPHPADPRDCSCTDHHHHHHGSCSVSRHMDDEANVHARSPRVTGINATSATATANVLRSVPPPALTHCTIAEAADDRGPTHPSTTSNLATHDDHLRRAAGLHRPATANELSPLSNSDRNTAALHSAAPSASDANGGCSPSDATLARRGSDENEEKDMFSSIARDVFGGVHPQLRTCEEKSRLITPAAVKPTPTAQCVAIPAITTAIKPSLLSVPHSIRKAASTPVDCAWEKRATLPKRAAAAATDSASALLPDRDDAATANQVVAALTATPTTTAKATEGVGDDLFESLYNNIMLND